LVTVSLDFPCTFFPKCLYNHCQGQCHIFSEICVTLDAVPLSDLSWNGVMLDTWLQIKWWKNQHVHPAVWNFVCWLPRYASTIIYHCIALIQLLYRWQHQSWKLWITPHIVFRFHS
jgi:hypothetical protein